MLSRLWWFEVMREAQKLEWALHLKDARSWCLFPTQLHLHTHTHRDSFIHSRTQYRCLFIANIQIKVLVHLFSSVYLVQGHGVAGVCPSCHWVKGGVHPRQVTGLCHAAYQERVYFCAHLSKHAFFMPLGSSFLIILFMGSFYYFFFIFRVGYIYSLQHTSSLVLIHYESPAQRFIYIFRCALFAC